MSSGLLALLDDVIGIAKIAAASVDDIAAHASKAGAKAAGVVIDDAAVTPRYVTGFAAQRELPIIGQIALGSVRNKILYLLPAAILLDMAAPWAVTPLLMLGGAYLCFEGAEKLTDAVWARPPAHGPSLAPLAEGPSASENLEAAKIRGAIRTDFILSAEIMAVTLATVAEEPVLTQALVLAAVGLGITGAVYGAVALMVKADDLGLAMAGVGCERREETPGKMVRGLGRLIVKGMPALLGALGWIGTFAMMWVGGGILLHGLETYGLDLLSHTIENYAEFARTALPALGGAAAWVVQASASSLAGLLTGLMLAPVVHYVLTPLTRTVAKLRWFAGS